MLQYNATIRKFVIDLETIEFVSASIVCTLRNMREALDLPFEPYLRPDKLTPIDYAGKNLLAAAKSLGIDIGAEWQNDLDLRQ